MTVYMHVYTADIHKGMTVVRERSPVGIRGALADCFVVMLMDGATPVDLTGSVVYARVIRPDGKTIRVDGDVSDGAARVTLTGECYSVSGDIVITITLTAGDVKQSVLRVSMDVLTANGRDSA